MKTFYNIFAYGFFALGINTLLKGQTDNGWKVFMILVLFYSSVGALFLLCSELEPTKTKSLVRLIIIEFAKMIKMIKKQAIHQVATHQVALHKG